MSHQVVALAEEENVFLGQEDEKQENGRRNKDHRPKCSQFRAKFFSSPKAFILIMAFMSMLSQSLRFFMYGQFSTIEKQFGFSSTKTGSLATLYNAGFLLAVIFVSHVGGKSHRPRVLGVSIMIMGMSGFIAVLPQFVLPGRKLEIEGKNVAKSRLTALSPRLLCQEEPHFGDIANGSSSCHPEREILGTSSGDIAYGFLATACLMQGVAHSARTPLFLSYVDDNLKKTDTPVVTGVVWFLTLLGAIISICSGGLFSKVYVLIYDPGFSYDDPRWIGAWWLGFIVFGALTIFISFPMLFFPKILSTSTVNKSDETIRSTPVSITRRLRELLPAMRRLFFNPVFVSLIGFRITDNFNLWSFAFLPKYIEVQFDYPVWKVFMISATWQFYGWRKAEQNTKKTPRPAMASTATAGVAMLVAGIIISKLRLSVTGMIKMMFICLAVAALALVVELLLGCPSKSFGEGNKSCSLSCACDDALVFPVCGSDGKDYISPCQAGCTIGANHLCSCADVGNIGTAIPGYCKDTACTALIPFTAAVILHQFFRTLSGFTSLILVARCICDNDRALGIGIAAFFKVALGSLPSGSVYGAVIDTACLKWNWTCGRRGSCALYDKRHLRLSYHGLTLGLVALSSICLFSMYCFEQRSIKRTRTTAIENTLIRSPTEGERKAI